MITYCDVNTCEDCPRYGDDCDGDKRVEHTDLISRADEIEAVRGLSELVDDKDFPYFEDALKALPSAEAEYADLPDIPRAYYEKVVGNMAGEINRLKEQLESAEAVQRGW